MNSSENSGASSALAVDACSVATRLTPEQIKNWRNVLCGMIGPYALIMPDDDVQRLRDQMQAKMGRPQNNKVRDARAESGASPSVEAPIE